MTGDIGHSKQTKILPILALFVFILGLLLSVIVKDEDKQKGAQLTSELKPEVLIHKAGN